MRGIAVAGILCSLLALWAAASAEGLYTAPQAEEGHQLFNNYCAECHRPDLSGAQGPALAGPVFKQRWGGKTVGELFNYDHSKMPPTNPGSIPEDKDWQITAYILQKNGLEAGQKDLGPATMGQTIPK